MQLGSSAWVVVKAAKVFLLAMLGNRSQTLEFKTADMAKEECTHTHPQGILLALLG